MIVMWQYEKIVVTSNICLLFYVCANPPSGDLSGAALEVPSEALLHLVVTFARCSPYFSRVRQADRNE